MRLIEGLQNNFPDTIPNTRPTARERRQFIEAMGWKLPRGFGPSDLTIATITTVASDHIDLFGHKLLTALYYETTGRALPTGAAVTVHWAQSLSPGAAELAEKAEEWFGEQRIGRRPNVDIGDQYRIRSAYNEEGDIFGAHVFFGNSLAFFMVAAPASRVQKSFTASWTSHAPMWQLAAALAEGKRPSRKRALQDSSPVSTSR